MPWDRVFPILSLIVLIFIGLWFIRNRKKEGFQAALARYNMSAFGGTEPTVPKASTTMIPLNIATSYGVTAREFNCEAGEVEVPCMDKRKQKCCRSPNIYIGIRKANGLGPIDLSANMMGNPAKPNMLSAEWINDKLTRDAYEAYQESQDQADTADDAPPDELPPDVPPDFGVSLGDFKSPVSDIPWDADNVTSLQKDILWGYVSPQASKSIWKKVYTQNLLSNLGNLNGDDQGRFKYHAPLLDIDIYDPNAAIAAQAGEFLLMNAVFPKIQEVLSIENIYNRFHKTSHKPPTPILKVERPVGPSLKSKVGAGKFKALKKIFANKYTKWFQKKLAEMVVKMTVKIAALKASLQAAVAAAGLASLGTAVPYAQSVASMISVVLDGLSTFTMMLSTIMLPVLDQLIDGEGMCPKEYKSLDTIIPQPAQTIIASFVPVVGDIIDMFYLYVCIRKPREETVNGLIAFVTGAFPVALGFFIAAGIKDAKDNTPIVVTKKKLEGQPYAEDSTLSVYYSDYIAPSIDGDGVGIIPPPLEGFQIKDSTGKVVDRFWCNFANPIMMDRMANFHYKYSYANPMIEEDGRHSYTYISGFIGVIASSELSCDVACVMKTITFNPVTGGDVSGSTFSPAYRRFYFIKSLTDPQGYFTVTGCTSEDDCAPDATALSTDDGANYVPSVPKVFDYTKITKGFDSNKLLADEMSALFGLGLSVGGGIVGSAIAAGASDQIASASSRVAGGIIAAPPLEQIDSYIAQAGCMAGTTCSADNYKYILRTTTDYHNINRGPVIEQSIGYAPEINFCQGIDGSGVLLTMDQCTDKANLRKAVEFYEVTYPTRRVKVVRAIEPRGIYGCYYLFDTVSYDPATNEEGIEYVPTETIAYYTIWNQTTCVRSIIAFGDYATADPIYKVPRTITIPVSLRTPGGPTVKYPTRVLKKKKGGPDEYVPINPREPLVIPSKLPKSTTLGDPKTCPNITCDKRTVIDKLIVEFNKAHPEDPTNPNANRKIQAALKAWTSASDRCDYEVEMLRFSGGKRIVQKETLSMKVNLNSECVVTRVSDGSDRINSGTFIQSNTPALSAPDTSGGILGYKSVANAIQTIFNNTIKPLLMAKPEVQLPAIATDANKNIETLSQLIFNEQILKACPTKSCRDLDVLKAIARQYNADNLPSEEFFVDKNVMGKILKSGVADETSCDVIFQNMRYEYDDVLQPPTNQVNTGMIYRFRLTPTGKPCQQDDAYMVKPGDYFDVSNNAIGVRSSSTTLFQTSDGQYQRDANIGYTVPEDTPVDCRSDASLAAVKAGLAVATGTTASTYRSVLWSYRRSNNFCEYKIKKDVTKGIGTTRQKTKLGVESFVSAFFGPTPNVTEYDLALIDFDEDGNASMNGKDVTLPFLANYDENKPSDLIDRAEKFFK